MIQSQLPILIIAIPLFMALAISIFGRKNDTLCFYLLVLGMAGTFAAALGALNQVLATGEKIHYYLGGWPAPHGIELVIDHLSSMVLCMVSGVALLVGLYSKRTVPAEVPFRTEQERVPQRVPNYYTLYCLLISGLLAMTATGDAFNLYVSLEIAALASYGLLALGRGRSYFATFKYLIMGTIGASFYLLGVGYLYAKTGSLNMADLHGILDLLSMHQSTSITIAFAMIMVGIWVKMAFFPLHGWLPNAYTLASNTSSCLIAPLMTKVSVYMMVRLMFSVFSANYVFVTLGWQNLVVPMAAVAIVFGSISALGQKNLKRMLTYIVIAEVGYMVGGAWLGNANGYIGAVYHILADGMMTLCVFMALGAVTYKTGDSSLESMRGIFRKMPITATVFVVGAFAMIGIPPTCGFFSKWYLVTGAYEAGQWFFLGALLFSSLINAIIFFRIIETGFFPDFSKEKKSGHHDVKVLVAEAPLSMLLPMVITAFSLLLIGLYSKDIINGLIRPSIPPGLF
ncbi:MAG: monovalent cation/H+ antiporter subunit D family protein [Desulfocapsa sp.]|nr:monovalent cation/H+ antiporter subunit D family protein [Desulfocapsa sp.]MBN4060039.1 monovalent cation/H+ antiporter subunit D family protein [Desulfotalea psychrophila]